MKHLYTIIALFMITLSTSVLAAYPSEQVWNASITNNQITCGIDYPNGSPIEGGILTAGESGTDGSKAITFNLRTNTPTVAWKLTEAKIVNNTNRYSFGDDLTQISSTSDTSVYVNNTEYSWAQAMQTHNVNSNTTVVKLAPKINMDQSLLPTGTTRIQGKIVVICSN